MMKLILITEKIISNRIIWDRITIPLHIYIYINYYMKIQTVLYTHASNSIKNFCPKSVNNFSASFNY